MTPTRPIAQVRDREAARAVLNEPACSASPPSPP